MSPPQNSTLLDSNLDSLNSPMLALPEELKRYSPILPLKDLQHNHQDNNNNQHYRKSQHMTRPSGGHHHHHQQEYRQTKQGTNRGSGQLSQRSRSISLAGGNSTVESYHKEIPILIGGEPRYVSGVTNKTTCKDIVKALIDDEILNGNYAYCGHKRDGAASRDYSDYVITESWRGIERSYDGNMAILPVWKAWSRVHNELRLSLKHRKDIRDPCGKPRRSKKGISSIYKYICKLLRFTKCEEKKENLQSMLKEQCLLSKKDQIPDEFLFVMLPDKLYDGEEAAKHRKNRHLKRRSANQVRQADSAELKEKLYRLSETRATVRKRRATIKKSKDKRQRNSFDGNNIVRKRKDAPIRSSIRHKLAQKTAEMDQLYNREYTLTKQLTTQCKLYKMQNDLYTNPAQQLEISIGQVQRNIEEYAKEIVETEHELFELKNEIKQDISIINNLKRMSLEPKSNERTVGPTEHSKTPVVAEQMQFVDNIYEFCDNNASMLV